VSPKIFGYPIRISSHNHQAKIRSLFDPKIPWALVISSFINKCGEMAINLLPMLLIERGISIEGSSLILGFTKLALVVGLFASGFLTDLLGYRAIVLASYFVGFVGFIALPFSKTTVLIGVFAGLAQLGSALFTPSARAMIREHRLLAPKKSLAWLRASSNLGQVISSILGILLGSFGLIVPFLLDGATSLLAFAIGVFSLGRPSTLAEHAQKGSVEKGFVLYSLALACFSFVYELGFLSFSGFSKMALGNGAIQAFSTVLLINTFFCGVCAVPAASFFRKPRVSLSLGVIVASLGMLLVTVLPKTVLCFALCALIMSLGEIVFVVHAQAILLANSHGKSSKYYGMSMMIQASGKLAAGVAVFPLVLRSAHPTIPFVVGPILFFVFLSLLPRDFLYRGES